MLEIFIVADKARLGGVQHALPRAVNQCSGGAGLTAGWLFAVCLPVGAEIAFLDERQRFFPLRLGDVERAGSHAVAAADAALLVIDDRAALQLFQRRNRADRHTRRFDAVHALVFYERLGIVVFVHLDERVGLR